VRHGHVAKQLQHLKVSDAGAARRSPPGPGGPREKGGSERPPGKQLHHVSSGAQARGPQGKTRRQHTRREDGHRD
jgi:hypothetical protein